MAKGLTRRLCFSS